MSTPGLSEMFAYHATTMANTIRTSLLVFTRMVSRPILPWPVTPVCSHRPAQICDLSAAVQSGGGAAVQTQPLHSHGA